MYYIQYLLLNHHIKYLPPNQQTVNFSSKIIQCGGHKGGAEGINVVPISEDRPRFCPTAVFTSRHSQPEHAKKSGIIWLTVTLMNFYSLLFITNVSACMSLTDVILVVDWTQSTNKQTKVCCWTWPWSTVRTGFGPKKFKDFSRFFFFFWRPNEI